jgi:dienelactone hydrolase
MVDGLRIPSVPWPALVRTLALVAALLIVAEPIDAEPPARPLADLVRDYLEVPDASRAASLLEEIQRDPRSTVEAVTAILRAKRPDQSRSEPVGLQPALPVRVGEQTFRYGLYVPPSYQATKDYSLVLCLHGAGFTGDAYLERWRTRLGDDYLLACPTLIRANWWTRTGEEVVLATIREVQSRYRVDPDRIFLTGMSNGGIGTWIIGANDAPVFAGLAPMAGGLDKVLFPFLENLRHTPVYVIHGAKDQVMPVDLSRSIVKELTRLGYPVVYREHERVHPMAGGHFFPREELPDLVAWFGARRRDPLPRRVTVVRDASHLIAFGWVRIDATDQIAAFAEDLTSSRDEAVAKRVYATLDAEIVAPTRIEVKTDRVRLFSLFLNEQLVDVSKPITVVVNGKVVFERMVTSSVDTLLRDARRRQDPQRLFPVVLHLSVEQSP